MKIIFIMYLLIGLNISLLAQEQTITKLVIEEANQVEVAPSQYDRRLKGKMKGQVLDEAVKSPLVGVNIMLSDTQLGTATDKDGRFIIENVPIGSYTVQFGYIGYEPLTKTDVIIRPKRITFLNTELNKSVLRGEQVSVLSGYFSGVKDQNSSTANFSSEEIRRAATIGGDINRIINGLPSLSNENQTNHIIARGGSPIENSFYVDNIAIPNINHFPFPGSTGGFVSLLNIDFIRNVDVYTGGFPASYGDVLSAVLDISYREGNRDEKNAQLDLNFTGLSGAMEGPVNMGKGSWMFSAKHSFTDILLYILADDEEPVIYNEFQGKIVYDLSSKHRISLINIFAEDRWNLPRAAALTDSKNWYGDLKMAQNTFGLNWRYLWGKKGYSNTSISHSFLKNGSKLFITQNKNENTSSNSTEQKYHLRNTNFYRINPSNKVEFGFEGKLFHAVYDNFFAENWDIMGNELSELRINRDIQAGKYGIFLTYYWNPIEKLTIKPGLRFDYFSFSSNSHFSPRFSVAYEINDKTSITGATGVYYQSLPMYFLSQNSDFKRLEDPVSKHYILSLSHLLFADTRLTIELYNKNYDHFPIDPAQPSLFILDEVLYGLFYTNHEHLIDIGQANSNGIELMIQKKLSNNFYGLISGTYFISKYRDLNGIWRNRLTDNRYLAALEVGYKPDYKWEFSLRWVLAGGMPYTPFDVEASQRLHHGVYDYERIMAKRLPDYQCLNVRFDRRFHFSDSNLIFYFSIWNVLDRVNYSYHFWDEYANSAGNYTQWPRLPVFGLELEL